jgi:hypothetical protein
MPLIDDVRAALVRLAPHGWAQLLAAHGFDINQASAGGTALADELRKPLNIQRQLPGFEDFALEGNAAIEPGQPMRSLLYHAFASPNVTSFGGAALGAYPTPREIEAVENYVFGVEPPTIQKLHTLANSAKMAVVVFAVEYRPGPETVSGKYADLCFSRTGVARVGNAPLKYVPNVRGFVPVDDQDLHAFRVLPARYSAYIAVQKKGDEKLHGPMRFSFRQKHPDVFGDDHPDTGDENRDFWVPLHKLFPGNECIKGRTITVQLIARHLNEKIRRVHLYLQSPDNGSFDTGWREPDLSNPPFQFSDGIANFSTDPDMGSGLLVPDAHPLVEEARYQNKPLTFTVPPMLNNEWSPSLLLASDRDTRARHAPEYVHVRSKIQQNGKEKDLNDFADVAGIVNAGNYKARHYVDFTGDGWIEAVCAELAPEFPRSIPAYSLVTAPDFFFNCDQREVMDWWLNRAPKKLRDMLWFQAEPLTLADLRVAPNLQVRVGALKPDFRADDDTVTSLVSMSVSGKQTAGTISRTDRHAWLPDAAAGYFAPGWDVSRDTLGATSHLAAYGLGSPFPEDSKLCAALATFWPAVAPDSARTYSDVFPTVAPLTDEEIGSTGQLPWDGVTGPRVAPGTQDKVDYADFEHVDFVRNSLSGKFSLALTSLINTERYLARVLAMARAYRAVGANTFDEKEAWSVLSFRDIAANDQELATAAGQSGVNFQGAIFRIEIFKRGASVPTNNARTMRFKMLQRTVMFVGGGRDLAVQQPTGNWVPAHVDV